MKSSIKKGCFGSILILAVLVLALVGLAWLQARRSPQGRPEYVALGSSFAAGAGLGALQQGSPWLCARSVDGYPQQLARLRRLTIVDMSCGGAVTRHLLDGGQFFQGAQIRAVDRSTRLVTITVGGNDIGYVGDLSLLAGRHSDTLWGWLVRTFWSGPKSIDTRNWAKLERELGDTIRAIHQRSPAARVVVATYPTILPPSGTCDRVALTTAEANLMRAVGDRLAATTRSAAAKAGATVLDMHRLGVSHNACSATPWTNGYSGIAPFHPTLLGARATADAIADKLSGSPAAIAPVRQDDAAGQQARRVGGQEQHD